MWLVHNACLSLYDKAKLGIQYAKNILNGKLFDKAMREVYEYTQIKMANGKVLDALIPGEEVISHKYTQLSKIKLETAYKYIDEIGNKYHEVMTASKKLDEQIKTMGQKVLEIPKQLDDIPPEVFDYAENSEVIIREVSEEVLKNIKFW